MEIVFNLSHFPGGDGGLHPQIDPGTYFCIVGGLLYSKQVSAKTGDWCTAKGFLYCRMISVEGFIVVEDCTREDGCKSIINKCLDQFGKIDI